MELLGKTMTEVHGDNAPKPKQQNWRDAERKANAEAKARAEQDAKARKELKRLDAEAKAQARERARQRAESAAQKLNARKPGNGTATAAPMPANGKTAVKPAPTRAETTTTKPGKGEIKAATVVQPGGAKTKKQRLDELTEVYRKDMISPSEYHKQRAKILAEP